MQETELIQAIRSIREEWQVEENIRVASEKLRQREMDRVRHQIAEAELEASRIRLEAESQAETLLENARAQARTLVKEKERELAELKAQFEKEKQIRLAEMEQTQMILDADLSNANAKGHAEGYEAGYAEGLGKFQYMVDSLSQLIAQVESRSDEPYLQQLPAIQTFVRTYVNKVVGILAENLIEVVLNNLDKGLMELSRAKTLKVVVSEQDYDTLMVMESEFRRHFPATAKVELLKDAAMKPGGCIIESELGSVDATLEGQLALLNQELRSE